MIMDLGNGTKKYFADAAGNPVPKPTAAVMVGSPAGLLKPDRYEFYTFDEVGDLVKRLMTLEEIQSIIANGESEAGEPGFPNYYHQNLPIVSSELSSSASSTVTDKVMEEAEATDIGELSSAVPGVHDVVMSVQNVLKGELAASKNKIALPKPVPSPATPTVVPSSDSSMSWSMILPGIMGNSGSVSSFANQSTFLPAVPVLNTTQELDNVATGTHSYVTKNVTLTSTQVPVNNPVASTSKTPLSPASSTILDVEQTTSNSVNTQSDLQSLHSILTTLHTSSTLPPLTHVQSSQLLSSLIPPSSLSHPSSQFTVLSSSPKPSSPISLTSQTSTMPSSTTMQVASIMTLMSQSTETPASPQPSLLPIKPLFTPTQKPQASQLNNSYFSTVETVTDPSVIIEDNLHINGNKPLISYGSYNKPGTAETSVTFSATAASTTKPVSTTHLPLSIFKIPSSASSVVEPESPAASAISSVTQSLLSLSPESFTTIPANTERITSPQKVVGVSTTNPVQTQSLAAETTTKIPSTSATLTESSSGSESTIMQHEYSESTEPATVMILSSGSSDHSSHSSSAAQDFLQVSTSAKNASFMTEQIQTGKPSHRPSTAAEHNTVFKYSPSTPVPETNAVHTQTQTMTQTSVQSRKPTKPPQTTLTTRNITKSTTQPHSVSTSVQSSTVDPGLTTKLNLAVTKDKIEDVPTADLQKTNVLSTKSTASTTTELPLQSTTLKNTSEYLLVNDASGLVPINIGSSVGAISLPVTANGNLDMPPELAESVLGVLSQVADVEGAATTIDYGEDILYSSSTITEQSVTDISSTHSSLVTTANDNVLQSSTNPLNYENITTESKNNVHHSPPIETLPVTHLISETDKQSVDTTQFFSKAPLSQELTNIYLQETKDNDPTTQYYSLENISNVYKQETMKYTTVDTGEELEKNDPVDVNKTEIKLHGKEDEKVAEEPNRLVEETLNIEAQKKLDNGTIEQKVVGNTNVELLTSASNNNGDLKTGVGILKKEPYYEKSATSELEDADSNVAANSIATTEVVGDTTTRNDGTKQKESMVFSVGDSTTEQPNSDRNTMKDVVNGESSGELDVKENSVTEVQYITTMPIMPESIISRDMTESSIQTTKESLETSTLPLTKYKKDDSETTKGSLQGNNTLKPSDKLEAVKMKPDNMSSVMTTVSEDEMQSASSENQETTTQSQPAVPEDETQTEELNTPTSATINNELLLKQETSIVDKIHEIILSSEFKTDTHLAGGSELTTYLPAEGKSEEDTGSITTSFETTAESFTTELTSSYETEVTTVDIKFTTDSEVRPSFQDEESKDTTDASAMEHKSSKETTTTVSLESKIDKDFTKTSLKTGSEMNVKYVNQWETKTTSSTGLLEKGTEPNINKTTAAAATTTNWTKISTLSPSQANNSKVRDKGTTSSTRSPVTPISMISATEEATAPAEILKFSGLNQEKVKDTKNNAQPEQVQRPQSYTTVDLEPAPHENLGLEATSAALEEDVRRFAELCNELAFRLWASITAKGLTTTRSVIMSPFAVTSLLAMVFLGARGPTSGQMNDILRLDDMVTFNPHQVIKNVTDSLTLFRNQGIATAAFVRELYSDRVSKVEVCSHLSVSLFSFMGRSYTLLIFRMKFEK